MAQNEEFFEDIDSVTTLIRFDKVYRCEDEMPKEFVEILKTLESFPVETRIAKIDSLYFDHCKKNNIPVGPNLADTSDPLLQTLSVYRQKSIQILESFEVRRSKL